LSGTGALWILASFLAKHRNAAFYLSNPTWGNHNTIFAAAGLDVRQYKYYDAKTKGLDINGMLADLKAATPGSIVLLHPCAHNPTGVDPTLDQWKQIAQVCKENQLYPFFDAAYQGFVTGDLAKDGEAMKYFLDQGFEMCISQSFAKIMGLYGERVGALHFVCGDKGTADKVMSQVKQIVRWNYSSPPAHGARIAAMILNDKSLREQWLKELVNVTNRIMDMR
jgi:aspartate/tyrosine/aromatic aminotransferase